MKQIILVLLLFSACARSSEDAATSIKQSFSADGCKVVTADYRSYWLGIDSCKTDAALKLELHNRIKNHKTIFYTQDSASTPAGYDFTSISDNLRYLNNYADPVPTRFDVWDFFIGIALKNANSRGITCPATNRVYDVYSGYCYLPAGTTTALINVPQLFNSSSIQDQSSMNREHSWPNSWFKSSVAVNDPATGNYCYNANSDSNYNNYNDYRAFTDVHHLLPTESSANQTGRSDYPYGIAATVNIQYTAVGAKAATPSAGGKQGTPDHSLMTNGAYTMCGSASGQVPCAVTTIFEPPDHMKGDIARIYFYMATRYYLEDSCWRGDSSPTPPYAVNKANINTWQENMLRKWHNDDPVDAGEITKNDLIQRIQGNRNPFIDHPEWVAKISDF